MNSEIKKYDMYKAGEYMHDSSQNEQDYWKLFNQIKDEELKLKICRNIDKIQKKKNLELSLVLAVMVLYGAFVGYIIGSLGVL